MRGRDASFPPLGRVGLGFEQKSNKQERAEKGSVLESEVRLPLRRMWLLRFPEKWDTVVLVPVELSCLCGGSCVYEFLPLHPQIHRTDMEPVWYRKRSLLFGEVWLVVLVSLLIGWAGAPQIKHKIGKSANSFCETYSAYQISHVNLKW